MKLSEKYPFQTYSFKTTKFLEEKSPESFNMMLNPAHKHELWACHINGLLSPSSEYGLAIKLKTYILAGKKLTLVIPANYELRRPDNGYCGFRQEVWKILRLGIKRGQVFVKTYSIDNIERDINNILFKFKETKMKFDVAICNFPYDGNLHLKMLKDVIPLCDKVVNIGPIRWLTDPMAKFKEKTYYKKYENDISKKIETLELIKTKYACDFFGLDTFTENLAITLIGSGGFDYTNINLLFEKVYNKAKHNQCIIDRNKHNGIRVRIATIGGTMYTHRHVDRANNLGKLLIFINGYKDGKPWYEHFQKNKYSKTTLDITDSILFNSVDEAKNFIDSVTNTIFGKWFEHNAISDAHVGPYNILWLNDYTHKWTDKLLCEYFGITGYIDDEHAEPGSEWEEIITTMSQYI